MEVLRQIEIERDRYYKEQILRIADIKRDKYWEKHTLRWEKNKYWKDRSWELKKLSVKDIGKKEYLKWKMLIKDVKRKC